MSSTTLGTRLHQVLPGIRARRADIEAARRVPADIVEQLVEVGVFALSVPRAFGGAEIEPLDQLRVIETLSGADGSVGWCAMIALGNGMFAGFMPEAGAEEVFADPTRPTAASIATTGTAVVVDGGYRVSGRWQFASGIDHAEWVLAGCTASEGAAVRTGDAAESEIIHVFVPIDDVAVHDTWYASGLCGSGSHDFSIDDVYVPERLAVTVFDRARHRPEPLYQVPVLALFAAHIAAVALGIARAAVDELVELTGEKTPSFSLVPLAEKPLTHIELARAEAALGAARAYLTDAVDDLWQIVATGGEPTARQHALCRAAAVHASETAAQVARWTSVVAGGSSIYASSPLQRHARDADAVLHHGTQSPQIWEECGRVLLGRAPLFPVF